MSETKLQIAAISHKAGRPANEDNFWVCPDVSAFVATGKVTDGYSIPEVSLSVGGALLAVADGMGGMRAGEVASQLVVDSLRKSFSEAGSVGRDDKAAVKKFIRQAIVAADESIKAYASAHRETAGMGSTIVLAWIVGDRVYVGWCGDSRAYCFNSANRLVRLSHDHSYVQSLVDERRIRAEDAFDHPDGNIITRSLGDSGEKAVPEVKDYPLHRGDVFLLCSDGLCGVLRDEEIERVMAGHVQSMDDCLKALWNRGQSEGWTDNVTITLARVVDGGEMATDVAEGYEGKVSARKEREKELPGNNEASKGHGRNKLWGILIAVLAFLVGGGIGFLSGKLCFAPKAESGEKEIALVRDSLSRIQRERDSLGKRVYELMEENGGLKQDNGGLQKKLQDIQKTLSDDKDQGEIKKVPSDTEENASQGQQITPIDLEGKVND